MVEGKGSKYISYHTSQEAWLTPAHSFDLFLDRFLLRGQDWPPIKDPLAFASKVLELQV